MESDKSYDSRAHPWPSSYSKSTGNKIYAIHVIREPALLIIFVLFLFLGRTAPQRISMPVMKENHSL